MNWEQSIFNDFPMYGISVSPSGVIVPNNTLDFIENSMRSEKLQPIVEDFVADEVDTSRKLKALENVHQMPNQLNVKIQAKQPRSIGGQIFRVKPSKYRSKYM